MLAEGNDDDTSMQGPRTPQLQSLPACLIMLAALGFAADFHCLAEQYISLAACSSTTQQQSGLSMRFSLRHVSELLL